jgi:hypothetical protein
VRFGPVFQVLGREAVLDQLTVRFLIANDDRPRVYLDDFPLDSEIRDKYPIATS